MLADDDRTAGRFEAAKSAYAKLVREGATERMSAAKLYNVGRFLLDCPEGESAAEEAKNCARELLIKAEGEEWKQFGFALEGAAEEKLENFAAAIAAYREALQLKCRTEAAPAAALQLGLLETKAGNFVKADTTLREAVSLAAEDPAKRAKAYLGLARNCAANGDKKGAEDYATVVKTLFDDDQCVAEAEEILSGLSEGAK